jgi:tetratricopeptide (TPR) repeat protein
MIALKAPTPPESAESAHAKSETQSPTISARRGWRSARLLAFALSCSFTAAALAQGTGPSPSATPRERRQVDNEEKAPAIYLSRDIMFQLLAAEIAVQRGQAGNAVATYTALAKSTRDPRLARRATELALNERSLERALQAAQLWYELAPDSSNAAQTVEALWISSNRFEDAEPLVAARLTKARADKTLPVTYQQLQSLLSRSTDKAGALAFIERLSQQDERVPEARLAVAGIAAEAKQFDRAAAEATVAMNLRADDAQTAVTAAQYVQQSTLGAGGAAQLLAGFLEKQPKAVEARFAYARLLAADGKTTPAREQMEIALKQEPDSPAILYSMAQLAYQLKQPTVAEGYLQRYVALPATVQRDNVPAYLFLAQIAEEAKQLEQSISHLEQIKSGDQFISALSRRALLMARLKRVDEARQLLRNTNVSTARERNLLTSAEAQVLREVQLYKEAFELLDESLQANPDNPELIYDQAMAAEKIDRIEVMETSLRKLIGMRPDYAHAYNALGYSLADRNLRLDEAQVLIEKALELSPEDPHIIDSMGWVLYRKGNLEKAIEWLEKAWAVRPEVDVAAHLGEVLWKAGKSAEARKIWQDAQRLDPNSDTLKETLGRLNVAL